MIKAHSPNLALHLVAIKASADSAGKRLQAGYQQLFEYYPLPMLVVNLATLRLMAANDSAACCYGYSVAQLGEMYLPDLYFEDDQASVATYMALGPQERATQRLWRHKGQGGQAIEVELDADDMSLYGAHARMLLVHDVTLERAQQRVHMDQNKRLPGAVQLLAEGFFALDGDARFTAVNRDAENILKVDRSYLLGKTLWERCPQADSAAYRSMYETVAVHKQAISFEFFFEVQQAWFEVRAFACTDGVSVFFYDVTERHKGNLRLSQERERLDAIVNGSSEAIVTIDPWGTVQTFNPGAERMFGVGRDQMIGKNINLLVPERFRAAHSRHHAVFAASKDMLPRVIGMNHVKGLGANGREISLEGSLAHIAVGEQHLLIATLRDVTAQEEADAERQHARAQLSHLARRLMLQEKELVKRMAQALHDQLGQTIAAIRIVHETMGVLRKGRVSREYLRLDQQLGKLVDQANRQVRTVLGDLHPHLLDEHGLGAALDNELRSRSLLHKGMNFELHTLPGVVDMRWPSAVEYSAFMIAREAIENALRHAGATQLSVRITGDPELLVLEVQDNGRGFPPDALRKTGHLGITGMLERAHSIGSAVTVRPVESGGTLVCLRWKGTE